MIVLVLTACPAGLRGHLTRWLLEVSAGVFVGHVTTRVRDELWARTIELISTGRAVMVLSAPTEQGFSVRSHGHHWEPLDLEGIVLMRRPAEIERQPSSRGWSDGGGVGQQGAWTEVDSRQCAANVHVSMCRLPACGDEPCSSSSPCKLDLSSPRVRG